MNTPEFQGTHLWDRLCWAKENLEPVQSDYRVVYEDSIDECATNFVSDPNFMAACMNGGIIPKVEQHWTLSEDEAKPDFKQHRRGYLLHDTDTFRALTEVQVTAIIILTDLPNKSKP